MRSAVAVLILMGLATPLAAQQPPDEASSVLSAPKQLGQASFRWLGIHLYDATLWSDAARFDWSAPMALELSYDMGISGADLLDTTMDEIARMEGEQPDQAALRQALRPCMKSVSDGDHYVAAASGADQISLWLNGAQTCSVSHAGVKQRFLGIWLADNSRSPALSRQLRGE